MHQCVSAPPSLAAVRTADEPLSIRDECAGAGKGRRDERGRLKLGGRSGLRKAFDRCVRSDLVHRRRADC
jgi:hypothetical protein